MKHIEITSSILVKFNEDIIIKKDSVDFSVIECGGKYYEPKITFVERDLDFEESKDLTKEDEEKVLKRLGFNEAEFRVLTDDEIKDLNK